MIKNIIIVCTFCIFSMNAMTEQKTIEPKQSYSYVKKELTEILSFPNLPLIAQLKLINGHVTKTKRPQTTFQSLLKESNLIKKAIFATLYRYAVTNNIDSSEDIGTIIQNYCIKTMQDYNKIKNEYIDTSKKTRTNQWLKQSIAASSNELCIVSTTIAYFNKKFVGRKIISIIPFIQNSSSEILFDTQYLIQNEWYLNDLHKTVQNNIIHYSPKYTWLDHGESTDVCAPYKKHSFIIGYMWGGFEIFLKNGDAFKRRQYITDNTISALNCSPDGTLIAIGSYDGTVAIYAISTAPYTKEKEQKTVSQLGCSFSDYYNDANIIPEYDIRLLFKYRFSESAHIKHIRYIDNKRLALCIGKTIYLILDEQEYEIYKYIMLNTITCINTVSNQLTCGFENGKTITMLPQKNVILSTDICSSISALSISPNKKNALIGFADGTVQLWDLKNEICTAKMQYDPPLSFVLCTPTKIIVNTNNNLVSTSIY